MVKLATDQTKVKFLKRVRNWIEIFPESREGFQIDTD